MAVIVLMVMGVTNCFSLIMWHHHHLGELLYSFSTVSLLSIKLMSVVLPSLLLNRYCDDKHDHVHHGVIWYP